MLLAWAPRRYESRATILISPAGVPRELVAPNTTASLPEQLQAITRRILSRTELERLIAADHLDAAGGLGPGSGAAAAAARMRADLRLAPLPATGEGGGGPLTAFEVDFTAGTRATAQRVDGQVAALFIAANERARASQSRATSAFLAAQVTGAAAEARAADAALRGFQARNLGRLPTQSEATAQELNGVEAQLGVARAALAAAEQQETYLESLLGQYRQMLNLPAGGGLAAPSPVDQKLAQLRAQLAGLRARYTEQYPDVRGVESEIARAEQQRAGEAKGGTAEAAAGASLAEVQEMAPLLQLESRIRANRRDLGDRRAALAQWEARAASLRASLRAAPLLQQELTALEQKDASARAQYEALLAKSNASQLATRLEQTTSARRFQLLDAPSWPQRPVSPNPVLFSGLGLLAGALLGLGWAWAREARDDRVWSSEELRGVFAAVSASRSPAVALWATVPRLATAAERRRRRLGLTAQWAAAVIAVVGMAAGNWLLLRRW